MVKLGEFLIEGDTLAVEQADLEHAQCQEVLRGYREVMDRALRKVAQQVQLELQDKAASYVRRLLRRMGYQFDITGEDPVVDPVTPPGGDGGDPAPEEEPPDDGGGTSTANEEEPAPVGEGESFTEPP